MEDVRPAAWDAEGLRARCERARSLLQVRQLAEESEIAAYWPGGEDNEEADPLGQWIYCFAQMSRLLDRLSPRSGEDKQAQLEQVLLAALRSEPRRVERVALSADGRPQFLLVYPQAEQALWHCASRDYRLAQCAEAMELARGLPLSETVDLLPELFAEVEYQQRVLVWIACTPPGDGLPFPEWEPYPDPPEWVGALDPFDVTNVLRAHHEVNARRLAIMQDRAGFTPEVRRPSWAVLAGAASTKLGIPSEALLRRVPLTQWFAQLRMDAKAHEEAAADAKQQAGRPAFHAVAG